MTKPTGNPPGRPPGARNKRTKATAEAAEAAARAIEAVLPDAFNGDAHAFLMAVYKDPRQPIELRLEAAGKAISYEKPKLAAIDVTSLGEAVVYDVSDEPLTDEQWLESCLKH